MQRLSQTGTCFLPGVSPPPSQGLTRLLPIPGAASQNSLYPHPFSHTSATSLRETPGAWESCPNCPCMSVTHWTCDCPRTISVGAAPPVTLWLRSVSVKFLFLLHSCLQRCYPPEHSIPAPIPTMGSSPLLALASQAIVHTSAF